MFFYFSNLRKLENLINSKTKIAPQNDAGDKSKPKPKKPSNKKHQSVLQLKLGRLAVQIGYIGIASAILTFIILLVRMLIVELAIRKLEWSNTFIKYILSYLIQAITVVVVAVPEGLPLAVTLALAYAVQVCGYHFHSNIR